MNGQRFDLLIVFHYFRQLYMRFLAHLFQEICFSVKSDLLHNCVVFQCAKDFYSLNSAVTVDMNPCQRLAIPAYYSIRTTFIVAFPAAHGANVWMFCLLWVLNANFKLYVLARVDSILRYGGVVSSGCY